MFAFSSTCWQYVMCGMRHRIRPGTITAGCFGRRPASRRTLPGRTVSFAEYCCLAHTICTACDVSALMLSGQLVLLLCVSNAVRPQPYPSNQYTNCKESCHTYAAASVPLPVVCHNLRKVIISLRCCLWHKHGTPACWVCLL